MSKESTLSREALVEGMEDATADFARLNALAKEAERRYMRLRDELKRYDQQQANKEGSA